ncbi:hypothetical protein PUN28_000687 [Cardiocondyla obscurior]|uniref:Uncharacterized protein n=1 Tax=Cardiocondyla obscurior TaxID=286306 RepID=A0AAW2H0K8_9HYME
MCFYIRDRGRREEYKEGTERERESEREVQRGRRCGRDERQRRAREKGEEKEAANGDRAESDRASGRETEIRDEERGEREDKPPPLLPRVVTPNAGDISTNQITPRAPPFIIILLVFPLLHPHWMTFPRPYRGQKRHPLPEEDSMLPPGVWCPLVPSWYLPWSSRDLLRRETFSRRLALLASVLCTCGDGACMQRRETLSASWFDFVPPKPSEPRAGP